MSDDDRGSQAGGDEDTEVLVTGESQISSSSEAKSQKKKEKKGVFNKEWLKMPEYEPFLKEYKLDASKATCIACNQNFSLHYRGKADVDNHVNTQKHQNHMKTFRLINN